MGGLSSIGEKMSYHDKQTIRLAQYSLAAAIFIGIVFPPFYDYIKQTRGIDFNITYISPLLDSGNTDGRIGIVINGNEVKSPYVSRIEITGTGFNGVSENDYRGIYSADGVSLLDRDNKPFKGMLFRLKNNDAKIIAAFAETKNTKKIDHDDSNILIDGFSINRSTVLHVKVLTDGRPSFDDPIYKIEGVDDNIKLKELADTERSSGNHTEKLLQFMVPLFFCCFFMFFYVHRYRWRFYLWVPYGLAALGFMVVEYLLFFAVKDGWVYFLTNLISIIFSALSTNYTRIPDGE